MYNKMRRWDPKRGSAGSDQDEQKSDEELLREADVDQAEMEDTE
jgi:hypothetical protein